MFEGLVQKLEDHYAFQIPAKKPTDNPAWTDRRAFWRKLFRKSMDAWKPLPLIVRALLAMYVGTPKRMLSLFK